MTYNKITTTKNDSAAQLIITLQLPKTKKKKSLPEQKQLNQKLYSFYLEQQKLQCSFKQKSADVSNYFSLGVLQPLLQASSQKKKSIIIQDFQYKQNEHNQQNLQRMRKYLSCLISQNFYLYQSNQNQLNQLNSFRISSNQIIQEAQIIEKQNSRSDFLNEFQQYINARHDQIFSQKYVIKNLSSSSYSKWQIDNPMFKLKQFQNLNIYGPIIDQRQSFLSNYNSSIDYDKYLLYIMTLINLKSIGLQIQMFSNLAINQKYFIKKLHIDFRFAKLSIQSSSDKQIVIRNIAQIIKLAQNLQKNRNNNHNHLYSPNSSRKIIVISCTKSKGIIAKNYFSEKNPALLKKLLNFFIKRISLKQLFKQIQIILEIIEYLQSQGYYEEKISQIQFNSTQKSYKLEVKSDKKIFNQQYQTDDQESGQQNSAILIDFQSNLDKPYSQIGLLICIKQGEQSVSTSTAFLIDQNTLVTCIHSFQNKWKQFVTTEIIFIPSCVDHLEQFRYTQKISKEDVFSTNDDPAFAKYTTGRELAVIFLKKPIRIGVPFIPCMSSSEINNNQIQIIGYPQNRISFDFNNHQLKEIKIHREILQGKYTTLKEAEYAIQHKLLTKYGMSGSPIIVTFRQGEKKKQAIIGIHTHGATAEGYDNMGLLFTPQIMQKLELFIRERHYIKDWCSQSFKTSSSKERFRNQTKRYTRSE